MVPGKNDTGTNTEISTSEVATTALDTSAMATEVAVCESVLSSLICRCAFSMTTMASSTTSPVASVMPNSVSELMEKPKILMKAKVPISETGMVTAGMMVARQSSRKRKITMMTMITASSSVVTTSRTESPTTVVVSKAMTYLMPGGNDFESSTQRGLGGFIHFQRVGVRQAAARRCRWPRARCTEGWCRSFRRRSPRARRPSAARCCCGVLEDDALEFLRIRKPAHHAQRDLKVLFRDRPADVPIGRREFRRSAPASADTTSAAVNWRAASFVGSSQMRMAYLRSPKMMTSPTPGMRFSASLT